MGISHAAGLIPLGAKNFLTSFLILLSDRGMRETRELIRTMNAKAAANFEGVG
jgi:hypothetical protein